MANNCLVTKLNGTVNAQLPVLGIMKFHVPYSESAIDDNSYIRIGSSGSQTKASTTGLFKNLNLKEVTLNPYEMLRFVNRNDVGGTEIDIENYYDVIDLCVTETIIAGIEKDSNLDSLMRMNLKRYIYIDTNNLGKSLDYLLEAKNLIALCVKTALDDEMFLAKVIKNNPNLVYVEKNPLVIQNLTEDFRQLTLQENWLNFVGNIEFVGNGVKRKDVNSVRDFGSLDNLITKLRTDRPTGSIRMDFLKFGSNITIGNQTAQQYCTEHSITSTSTWVTWDASTISITDTQPQDYVEPSIGINSQEIQNLVYAH